MKGKFVIISLIVLLLRINSLQAQNPCDCTSLLETLVKKIDENYIGYALTKDKKESAYKAHIELYSEQSKNTSGSACTSLLQRFLRFFEDGHLFVTEIPKYDDSELALLKSKAKEKMFDVKLITDHLIKNKATLDNIEGIWTDGESKYAIIKNKGTGWNYEYVAVILSHAQSDKIGELKLGVTLTDGRLEGAYYTNNYAPSYTSVELRKDNSLLSIWGGRLWARVEYTDENSMFNGKIFNPKAAVVSALDAETALVSIPTFLIEKKDFDFILSESDKMLKEVKYLIIDIRGNSGGNGIYFDMLSLFADREAPANVGLALASDDNVTYFKQFGKGPVYDPVVNDMEKNKGQIVDGPRYQTLKIKPRKSNIEKVAIITDNANMSAAESSILHAKGVSSKVFTIGKNTKGVIDYQSINSVKLNCDKLGIYFGYPTSSSTKEVPAKGYNKTGIAPDVLTEKIGRELIELARVVLKK